MKVEVREATLRDLCYTAANAREADRSEILASGPRNLREAAFLTHYLTENVGGLMFCVWVDDNPEYAFGFTRQSELTPWLFSGWAWGSEKTALCMPEMSRWARGRLIPMLDSLGAARVEARSAVGHCDAHRWLLWLGFTKEADLVEWGRDRSNFVLFAWVRSQIDEGRFSDVFRGKPASTTAFATDAVDRRG